MGGGDILSRLRVLNRLFSFLFCGETVLAVACVTLLCLCWGGTDGGGGGGEGGGGGGVFLVAALLYVLWRREAYSCFVGVRGVCGGVCVYAFCCFLF